MLLFILECIFGTFGIHFKTFQISEKIKKKTFFIRSFFTTK